MHLHEYHLAALGDSGAYLHPDGLKVGWKLRQLCGQWQAAREERIRQQIINHHRLKEEMKDERAEALQCARGMQAAPEV